METSCDGRLRVTLPGSARCGTGVLSGQATSTVTVEQMCSSITLVTRTGGSVLTMESSCDGRLRVTLPGSARCGTGVLSGQATSTVTVEQMCSSITLVTRTGGSVLTMGTSCDGRLRATPVALATRR